MQFLGLNGREAYSEPQILAAYEDLVSTIVEEGYSSRVQDGKLRMLDQAVDEVRNQSSVESNSDVQVQWDDLPGALALLQEVRAPFLFKFHSASISHSMMHMFCFACFMTIMTCLPACNPAALAHEEDSAAILVILCELDA